MGLSVATTGTVAADDLERRPVLVEKPGKATSGDQQGTGLGPVFLDVSGLSDFRLPACAVDVRQMVEEAGRLQGPRFQEITDRVLQSPIWGTTFPSVRHDPAFGDRFERIAGASFLNLDNIQIPGLREFFDRPGYTFQRNGRTESRGAAYYVAYDKNYNEVEKLARMERDIRRACSLVLGIDRRELRGDDYFAYLGVLDYLKVQTLVLFNAVTYRERSGQFRYDTDYDYQKAVSYRLADTATRAYYQCMLGQPFGGRNAHLSDVPHLAAGCIEWLRTQEFEPRQFKMQEVDHPLVIAANAHENALTFTGTDLIVGLPLGGLQPSLVTRLAFELLHGGRRVDVIAVPLSTHSGKERNDSQLTPTQILQVLEQNRVRGRNVLVTEDNSNTGNTAQLIADTLVEAGVASVHVSLVEVDPRRVTLKQARPQPPEYVVNLLHPDFRTAVRNVPIRNVGGTDAQMVKIYAERVIERFHASNT